MWDGALSPQPKSVSRVKTRIVRISDLRSLADNFCSPSAEGRGPTGVSGTRREKLGSGAFARMHAVGGMRARI